MKRASATAMISAAALLAPACSPAGREPQPQDPLRRSTFRALSAQAFLLSCPGAAGRGETRFQQGRLEELRQLALRKHAGRALWLGENDWAAASRFDEREACRPGDKDFEAGLTAFSASLDQMAGAVAAWRP